MEVKRINTDKAPKAIGPYSQAVKCGNMLYLSGQIPSDPETGTFVGTDAATQAEQVFKNINAVLEAAGTNISHVVKATVFLADMKDFASVNAVYEKAFSSCSVLPARSAFQVSALPKGALVEIETVAYLD